MRWNGILVLPVFVMATALAHSQTLLQNGDFEATRAIAGPPSVDQGFGVWKLGQGNLAPADWSLNPAFPGELAIVPEGAHAGKNFLRLRATVAARDAHIYQPCPAIQAGNCYVVSAWVRGGKANLFAYEYGDKALMKTPAILAAASGPDQWRQVSAYYIAPEEGLTSVTLAIGVAKGETVDVDDVRIEAGPALPATLEPVTLESDLLRIRLSRRGTVEEFSSRQSGVNLVTQGPPVSMFQAVRAGADLAVWYIERKGDILEVHFSDPTVTVSLKIEPHPHYLALAVQQVSVPDLEWLQLADLRLQITENVGTLINAAWDTQFGACVLACNDRTHSYGADRSRAVLGAKSYGEFGLEGAKIAIIGTPTNTPDPTSKLLDIIEEVELDQGLPHLTINGVWIKRHPARFASYLEQLPVSERNVDQVIEFAKGGFGCIELYPWHSTPSYGVNPRLFPNGVAGLKKVADKIHAAGLLVGVHIYQGMVGWGGMHDPYVVPKADPRLLQDRYAALAAPLDAKATEIAVKERTAGWPEKGDLFVEGEIVRYARLTETGFAGCSRGLWGTTVGAHPAGTRVGRLVIAYAGDGSLTTYAPDVNSSMIDEICDNMARVLNDIDADVSYFDAGEEVNKQPPHWRNQGRIVLGLQQRLKKPVIIGGNDLYTNLSWHVIARGGPYGDAFYTGRRELNARYKGQSPVAWGKNLLPGDVGWFEACLFSPSHDAVTPDEVLQLCLKGVGGMAPISFYVDPDNLWGNRRMPEMQAIIRTCEELKRRDYFTPEARAELLKPAPDYTLEQAPSGAWELLPLQFGPPRVVSAQRPDGSEWRCTNPYGEQAPWVRIRARTRLAPYGAKENLVLADFATEALFMPDGTASAELTQSVTPSQEKTPDGSSAFCYRVVNQGQATSSWCRLTCTLPKGVNLVRHRRLGLWVYSEGRGGILNVQLDRQTNALHDHYVPLDFKGWSYRELDPPEDARFFDYRWPYSFYFLFHYPFLYNPVTAVHLYANGLPPGETVCLIGRIEARREDSLPLESPTLEVAGQKLAFPVTLKPDEYVEMDWTGACRHFEPNGGLLAEVKPQGQLRLAQRDNSVSFSCTVNDSTSPRAEVTLAVKGAPLPNAVRQPAAPVKAVATAADQALRFLPDGKGGLRIVHGLHELVDRQPAHLIPVFDGKANVWTVVNDAQTSAQTAVVIARGTSAVDADYDDPNGLLIESFDDPALYAMSETNQFAGYVLGDARHLSKTGPVREGVSQSFATAAEDVRVGGHCGVYTATNDGAPGGWCGIGRRFAKPLDLSAYQAVAFWACGDGKGELLRFQFYDVAGAWADWSVPINFTGWRLLVFGTQTSETMRFDWKQTEYVLFYFNNIPAKTTVAVKLDDLKALPRLRPPPRLCRPVLTVADKKLTTDVELDTDEALTVDATGRCLVWRAGQTEAREIRAAGDPIVLMPGPNRFELTCDTAKGAPRDVTVRVVRLGMPEP